MAVGRSVFGTLADGSVVEAICLSNGIVSATIITYGATLQALHAPDRHGVVADVVLGHDDLASYVRQRSFLGPAVGRYANRIAGGRFTLDGETFRLDRNEGRHCLHGGHAGFDQALWRIEAIRREPHPAVVLTHTSAEGEGGFPGRLAVRLTCTLEPDGTLLFDFEAMTTRPTCVNITNHAVFNLAGADAAEDIAGHRLAIHAGRYTPVDARLLPTGELRAVTGSPFDFRLPRSPAAAPREFAREPQLRLTGGYNQNFVLDKGVSALPLPAARLDHPGTGRVLEVLTTRPGLQVYGSNHFDGTLVGKGGRAYGKGHGLALEPQDFPDAPNQPHFPSTRIDPGRPYRHVLGFRMSVAAAS